MNIYVGNLPYSANDDTLRSLFSAHGEVSSASVISDKFTSQSKGFGFVEMPKQAEAEDAIEALNGSDLEGRNLTVNQARPREDRPRPPRGGGGGGGYGGGGHGGGGGRGGPRY